MSSLEKPTFEEEHQSEGLDIGELNTKAKEIESRHKESPKKRRYLGVFLATALALGAAEKAFASEPGDEVEPQPTNIEAAIDDAALEGDQSEEGKFWKSVAETLKTLIEHKNEIPQNMDIVYNSRSEVFALDDYLDVREEEPETPLSEQGENLVLFSSSSDMGHEYVDEGSQHVVAGWVNEYTLASPQYAEIEPAGEPTTFEGVGMTKQDAIKNALSGLSKFVETTIGSESRLADWESTSWGDEGVEANYGHAFETALSSSTNLVIDSYKVVDVEEGGVKTFGETPEKRYTATVEVQLGKLATN